MDMELAPAGPGVAATADGQSQATHLRLCRLSHPAETEILLPLVRAWHAESMFAHLPFSERKFMAQAMTTIKRKDKGAGFYVARGSEALGLIDVAVGEAWLSEGGCYATCLGWFVHPRVRRSLLGGKVAGMLLEQGRAWAKACGATEMFVHGTHSASNGLKRRGTASGANIFISL